LWNSLDVFCFKLVIVCEGGLIEGIVKRYAYLISVCLELEAWLSRRIIPIDFMLNLFFATFRDKLLAFFYIDTLWRNGTEGSLFLFVDFNRSVRGVNARQILRFHGFTEVLILVLDVPLFWVLHLHLLELQLDLVVRLVDEDPIQKSKARHTVVL
jgi:hypothetical protein